MADTAPGPRDETDSIIHSERLDLFSMPPEAVTCLAAGDRADAEAALGLTLPTGWPEPSVLGWLTYRKGQMEKDPGVRPWLMRAVVVRSEPGRMIGNIGFHGRPVDGRAEIGYEISPPHRRRGYASEAVSVLIDWATREHAVQVFIASVSPSNIASRALISKLGFERTGQQWDDEDGLELVFQLTPPNPI